MADRQMRNNRAVRAHDRRGSHGAPGSFRGGADLDGERIHPNRCLNLDVVSDTPHRIDFEKEKRARSGVPKKLGWYTKGLPDAASCARNYRSDVGGSEAK